MLLKMSTERKMWAKNVMGHTDIFWPCPDTECKTKSLYIIEIITFRENFTTL